MIIAATDQPPKTLAKTDDRHGQVHLMKGIAAGFTEGLGPGLEEGFRGNPERKAGHDKATECLTFDIHPFPKLAVAKSTAFFSSIKRFRSLCLDSCP